MIQVKFIFARFRLALGLWLATLSLANAYGNGITPSGANPADATTAFNSFKTTYFTNDCGATYERVRNNPGSGSTVSEGMGYGMLMVAYLEPDVTGPALMTKLWNFVFLKIDAFGLMNWNVTCGGGAGTNAATDADLDIALALIQAEKRWPGNSFGAYATTFINNIKASETDGCGLKPGDNWGGCGNLTYPSYISPSYFTTFKCFTGDAAWDTVKTNCYNQLNYWYVNYALPPEQINATTGAQWSGDYQYNSCRVPWRLSMDYLWNGNTAAQNMCQKIVNNFKTTDPSPSTIGDGYVYSTGAKNSGNHNAAFEGPAGDGAMVGAANQAWLNSEYTDLAGLAMGTAYYPDAHKVLSLMVQDGIFVDPCASGPPPTPTNTPTKTPTPTLTNSPTKTPTPTMTNSSTLTPTRTPTNSPTNSPTPSPTATSTATLTNSPTPTVTNTPTLTATRTFTTSPTNSPTPSPTSTQTNTPTNSPTPTVTNSPTITPTRTPTRTPTNSLTPTPTSTPSDSPTVTPTPTFTLTGQPTSTPTPTGTPTNTPTLTPSNSPTLTATSSPTSTPTLTVTNTLTNPPTHTPTPTATLTPTSTPTPTATNTFTGQPTNTPTSTASNSPSPTPSNTPSATATNTNTAVAVNTYTFTPTNTPTPGTTPYISPPYPNPVDQGPVVIDIVGQGIVQVKWDVFTTAFRKVKSQTQTPPVVNRISWDLTDLMGVPVASGLYFIRVEVSGLNTKKIVIKKVLVIR